MPTDKLVKMKKIPYTVQLIKSVKRRNGELNSPVCITKKRKKGICHQKPSN
jgi:hypothetical protein